MGPFVPGATLREFWQKKSRMDASEIICLVGGLLIFDFHVSLFSGDSCFLGGNLLVSNCVGW